MSEITYVYTLMYVKNSNLPEEPDMIKGVFSSPEKAEEYVMKNIARNRYKMEKENAIPGAISYIVNIPKSDGRFDRQYYVLTKKIIDPQI